MAMSWIGSRAMTERFVLGVVVEYGGVFCVWIFDNVTVGEDDAVTIDKKTTSAPKFY